MVKYLVSFDTGKIEGRKLYGEGGNFHVKREGSEARGKKESRGRENESPTTEGLTGKQIHSAPPKKKKRKKHGGEDAVWGGLRGRKRRDNLERSAKRARKKLDDQPRIPQGEKRKEPKVNRGRKKKGKGDGENF